MFYTVKLADAVTVCTMCATVFLLWSSHTFDLVPCNMSCIFLRTEVLCWVCVCCSYYSGENAAAVESVLTESPRHQIHVPSASSMLASFAYSHLQQPYPANTDMIAAYQAPSTAGIVPTDRLVADETVEYEYKPSTWPRKHSTRHQQARDNDDNDDPARLAANQHEIRNDSGRLAWQHDCKSAEAVFTTSCPLTDATQQQHYVTASSSAAAVEEILAASAPIQRSTGAMAPAASQQHSVNPTLPTSSYSVQQQLSRTSDTPGAFLYPYTGYSPSHRGQRSPAVERSPAGQGSLAVQSSLAVARSEAGQGSPAVQRSSAGWRSPVDQRSQAVERSTAGQGSPAVQRSSAGLRSPAGQRSQAVERSPVDQRSPMAVSGAGVTMEDGRHAVDLLFDNLFHSSSSSQCDAALSTVTTTTTARTFPASPHIPAHSPHVELYYLSDEPHSHAADLTDTHSTTTADNAHYYQR